MAYERISRPTGSLYHYTRRNRLESILKDGLIRRMGDKECWFCTSLEDTMALMKRTVMQEGKPYYGLGGVLLRYPAFVPEDYVILKLEPRYQNGEWVRWNQEMPPNTPPEILEEARVFSHLKVGFRGDLKFKEHPEILEVSQLIFGQNLGHGMKMEL